MSQWEASDIWHFFNFDVRKGHYSILRRTSGLASLSEGILCMLIPFSLFRELLHPKTTHFSTIFSVYFNECLYVKKKVYRYPFAQAKITCTFFDCLKQCLCIPRLLHPGWVDSSWSAKVFMWRKVGPTRRVTLLANPHVNGLPYFLGKCMNS